MRTSCAIALRFAGLLVLLGMGLKSVQPASAIAFGECASPVLFDAAVNIVILPYTYVGRENEELTSAARGLSTLIQFDAVANARYGSIGVVELRGSAEDCKVETILSRLAGWPTIESEVRPGAGIILVWGRFFEEGENIYVQSYLISERRLAANDINLKWHTKDQEFSVAANLPVTRLVFAPRTVSQKHLAELGEAFKKANIVRTAPSLDAPAIDIDLTSHRTVAYGVRTEEGGWLSVDSYGDTPSGYVQIGSNVSQSLRDALPELHFVDELTGYLTYRAVIEYPEIFSFRWPEQGLKLMEESLMWYQKNSVPAKEPEAAALATIVPSAAKLVAAEKNNTVMDILGSAMEQFRQAALLFPHSADITNLIAVGELYKCCAVSASAPKNDEIERAFFRALALAPMDLTIVSNLDTYYEFIAATGASDALIDPGELKKRQSIVRDLRKKLQ